MMKTHLLAAAAALAVGAGSSHASDAVAEQLSYRAFIGGLPLGTLEIAIAIDEERYAAQAQFLIGRWLRWALDTDARAAASGRVRGSRLVPDEFDYWVRDEEKERRAKIDFDADGNPSAVRSDPPFERRDYDVTLEQVRGAVDPATGVALLSAPRDAPCELDMTVFDGRKYHRITLSPGGGTAEAPICNGRYERLGGFKAKYMTDDRRAYDFRAELTAIGPNRWRPRRVSAKTKFGSGVVVLQ